MQLILLWCCLITLLGCSDVGPPSVQAHSDELPAEIEAAWLEIQSLVQEANTDSDSDADGTVMSVDIADEPVGYVLKFNMKIEMEPTTGGGIVLNEAHIRKKDAWLSSSMIIQLMAMEVDKHEVFSGY